MWFPRDKWNVPCLLRHNKFLRAQRRNSGLAAALQRAVCGSTGSRADSEPMNTTTSLTLGCTDEDTAWYALPGTGLASAGRQCPVLQEKPGGRQSPRQGNRDGESSQKHAGKGYENWDWEDEVKFVQSMRRLFERDNHVFYTHVDGPIAGRAA